MNLSAQVQLQNKAYKNTNAIQKIESTKSSHLDADSQQRPFYFTEDKQKTFAQILKKKLDQTESK